MSVFDVGEREGYVDAVDSVVAEGDDSAALVLIGLRVEYAPIADFGGGGDDGGGEVGVGRTVQCERFVRRLNSGRLGSESHEAGVDAVFAVGGVAVESFEEVEDGVEVEDAGHDELAFAGDAELNAGHVEQSRPTAAVFATAVTIGHGEGVADVLEAVQVVSNERRGMDAAELHAEQRADAAAKERRRPLVVGHLCIGVVRADLVEAKEHEEGGVGDLRKRQSSVGKDEVGHCQEHEDVFQHPVRAIGGRPTQCQEDHREECEQYRGVPAVAGFLVVRHLDRG